MAVTGTVQMAKAVTQKDTASVNRTSRQARDINAMTVLLDITLSRFVKPAIVILWGHLPITGNVRQAEIFYVSLFYNVIFEFYLIKNN